MFYEFKEGLEERSLNEQNKQALRLGIIRSNELENCCRLFGFSQNTLEEFQSTSHTIHKMDSYFGYDFALMHAIKRKQKGFDKILIGMYIKEDMILLVCDDLAYEKHLYDAIDKMNETTFCLEHMISAILNCVLHGNLRMIEDMENELSRLDDDILNNKTENFNQNICVIRNDLLYLTHYYEQLIDVCEELLQDENNFFKNQEIHHLRILSDRILRLHGNVQLLKDYMLQIREACQSQMDMNLNHIMYIFTVVTTIFLPLTLIVGWYGMNFTNMPELRWKYGYISVVVISIIIVLACVWFFRKKKLLK